MSIQYATEGGGLIYSRSLLHSEEVYGDDVDEFKPERFMKPDVKYPDTAYGFGRRSVGLLY